MTRESTIEVESQAITRLTNILARHVVPVFAETSGGKPKLIGSSFLISSGKDSYLVSAAHVFDELLLGRELFFYIEPTTKRSLSGNLRLTKIPVGKSRDDDRLDVGVLKLEGCGLPPYPKVEKYPLTIRALMPNTLPREKKQYLIVGFPESKSRANPIAHSVVSNLYGFRNISVPSQKYADRVRPRFLGRLS